MTGLACVSVLFCFSLGVLISGCTDAPRDNPLDPLSPAYRGEGVLQGVVTLKGIGTPVAGAVIRSVEGGVETLSGTAGDYAIPRLGTGVHTLVCAMENCVPDTVETTLQNGASQTVNFSLNSAPLTLRCGVLTRKIDQYYPSPQYFADIEAEVTDPNGINELDSVWFEVEGIRFPLEYIPSTKLFAGRIFKYDLPTNTIQWLVGRPLAIVSDDVAGAENRSAHFFVTRVIENGATPVSPSALTNDTTSGTPLLRWIPPSVTFNYTYTLSISRVDAGTETVVWTLSANSGVEEMQFPGDGSGAVLPSGNYVWAVTVVDEFGNTCRSKQLSFVVR